MRGFKKVFLVSLIIIIMGQIGCASASKKKVSELKKEDCKECKKKSR